MDESPTATARRFADRSGDSAVALTDTVALDGHVLQRVYVEPWADVPGDTLWTVLASVSPAAAEPVGAFFSSHMERHIAVLVGKEVVQTAVIAGTVDSVMPLRIQTTKQIADSLVKRVRSAIGPGCADR